MNAPPSSALEVKQDPIEHIYHHSNMIPGYAPLQKYFYLHYSSLMCASKEMIQLSLLWVLIFKKDRK